MGIERNLSAELIKIIFSGEVSADEFNITVGEVTEFELEQEKVPDKLVLLQTNSIDLDFDKMFPNAKLREATQYSSNSKTAIVVSSDITYGLARMWQSMLNTPLISVEIFHAEDEAISWLNQD